MKMKTVALFAASTACLLSGCATLFAKTVISDLPPEAKAEIAKLFIERCGGTVSIGASGGSGQLGGAFTGDYRLTGTCPVPEGRVVPLGKLGEPPASAEPPL